MVNVFEIFANRYISPTVYSYTVMSDPRLNLESTAPDHFRSSCSRRHTNTPPSHAADPRWLPPSPNSFRGAPNAAEPLRRESAWRVDYFSLECFTSWFSASFNQCTVRFIRTVVVCRQWHWLIHITHVFSSDRPDPPHACIYMPSRTPTNNLFQASRAALDWTLHCRSKSNLNQTPLSSRSLCLDFGKLESRN